MINFGSTAILYFNSVSLLFYQFQAVWPPNHRLGDYHSLVDYHLLGDYHRLGDYHCLGDFHRLGDYHRLGANLCQGSAKTSKRES